MLQRLKQLVDEVAPLHSKLVLLVGPPGCGMARGASAR